MRACNHIWRRRVPLVTGRRTVVWRCYECRARAQLTRIFRPRRRHLRLVRKAPR